MVNYADLCIVDTQLACQLKGAKLELKEVKAHSLQLGACLKCPKLKVELDARSLDVKELETKLLKKPCVSVTSPLVKFVVLLRVSFCMLKSKLKQEVAYLSPHLERTKLSKKMIEEDLSQVEESATKSTYKGEKTAPKFVPSSNYHKAEESLKPTKTHYPSNPMPSFNHKRGVNKKSTNPCEKVYICMFCGHTGHLDEFFFRRNRMKKRCVDYARNSYDDEFLDFCLSFLLVLCLIFLTDLTITHMVLVHEKVVLCLDALVSTHALIMVFIPHVGMVFPQQVSIHTLSRVALLVHAIPIVVHVSLAQMVRCKGL
jgi:hypothetical protein